jgi:Macrocin-O-methyltransferase (TylF)
VTPQGLDLVKDLLTRAGPMLSRTIIHNLDATISYLEGGRWLKTNGFVVPKRVAGRTDVYDEMLKSVAEKQVLYLEFGVYRGRSMTYWANHLRHPGSHLHGFDSFEGLPESWNILFAKSLFSTNGEAPRIDDPRVVFFKGWFDKTLPQYEPPRHEQLVINVDSDLYSSAKTVLTALTDYIVPGTYIYFDEFCDRNNELRAFDEFLSETRMKFAVAAASRSLAYVAFRRTS